MTRGADVFVGWIAKVASETRGYGGWNSDFREVEGHTRLELGRILAVATAALVLGGCYSGVSADVNPAPAGADDSGAEATDGEGSGGGDSTGDDGGSDLPPTEADCPGPDQPRRLNRTELNNIALDVLGLDSEPFAGLTSSGDVADSKVGHRLVVSDAWVSTYVSGADDAALAYVQREGLASQCEAQGADCTRSFLEPLASQLLRRPVTAERMDSLVAIVQTALDNDLTLESGIVSAIAALFITPDFLYIGTNVGPEPGVYALDGYDIATRLALALWSSAPDAVLLDAAERGDLDTSDGIRTQVDRMLADPEKGPRFIDGWANSYLFLSKLDDAGAEAPEGADITQEAWVALLADMKVEAVEAMRHAFEEGEDIDFLVDPGVMFINERLASHYGIEGVEGEEFRMVEVGPDTPYGGLLTTGQSLISNNDLIHRGVGVLNNYLCVPIGAPSDEATLSRIAEQLESGLTEEEMVEVRLNDNACAGCHTAIDPIGTAFTQFDALGRHRILDDDGQPISNEQVYYGQPIKGPQSVRDLVLESNYEECFVPALLGPLSNREMRSTDEADACATESLLESVDGDLNLRNIVVAALTSGTFRTRVVGEQEDGE